MDQIDPQPLGSQTLTPPAQLLGRWKAFACKLLELLLLPDLSNPVLRVSFFARALFFGFIYCVARYFYNKNIIIKI